MKEAKVVYRRRRFRVFRDLFGYYWLQVRRLTGKPEVPEDWVNIELYDYYSNARVRAKQMDSVMDGWSKFEK